MLPWGSVTWHSGEGRLFLTLWSNHTSLHLCVCVAYSALPALIECLCASVYVYPGKSYLEWFTELVESLESNMFPRIDGRIYR